jgi:hypothetical protein
MARGAMPWTIAIEKAIEDGEWHSVSDVIAAGAADVPRERALEEMGEARATSADEDRRADAGAKTLARQALMGMRRFGKAQLSADKKEVRKVTDQSVSIGVLAERVSNLELLVAQLADNIATLSGGSLPTEATSALSQDQIDSAFEGAGSGTITGRFVTSKSAVEEGDLSARFELGPEVNAVGGFEVSE